MKNKAVFTIGTPHLNLSPQKFFICYLQNFVYSIYRDKEFGQIKMGNAYMHGYFTFDTVHLLTEGQINFFSD